MPTVRTLAVMTAPTMPVRAEYIAARMASWKRPAPNYVSGVFAKYMAQVSSAAKGAITSSPDLT